MSEDVGAIAQMVIDMREETELRVALDTAVESIFRRQLREAFAYVKNGTTWRHVK